MCLVLIISWTYSDVMLFVSNRHQLCAASSCINVHMPSSHATRIWSLYNCIRRRWLPPKTTQSLLCLDMIIWLLINSCLCSDMCVCGRPWWVSLPTNRPEGQQPSLLSDGVMVQWQRGGLELNGQIFFARKLLLVCVVCVRSDMKWRCVRADKCVRSDMKMCKIWQEAIWYEDVYDLTNV